VVDLLAYLNRLASAEPTPGGGSAATIVGALGAALVAMVARITLGNPKYAAVHGDAVLLVGDADALRAAFTALRADDEHAYAGVPRAQALPRATDAERAARTERLQTALTHAAEVPLTVAERAAALLGQVRRAAALGNAHLASDVECALLFGRAALDAASANVRINHRFMKNAAVVAEQQRRLTAIREAAADDERAIKPLLTAS
jgi:formiminotetrahydrofolate cyclodeaminase